MLKKIAIRNYRTLKSFDLDSALDINIVVGDNDAGGFAYATTASRSLATRRGCFCSRVTTTGRGVCAHAAVPSGLLSLARLLRHGGPSTREACWQRRGDRPISAGCVAWP
jgi:hypothetical protein